MYPSIPEETKLPWIQFGNAQERSGTCGHSVRVNRPLTTGLRACRIIARTYLTILASYNESTTERDYWVSAPRLTPAGRLFWRIFHSRWQFILSLIGTWQICSLNATTHVARSCLTGLFLILDSCLNILLVTLQRGWAHASYLGWSQNCSWISGRSTKNGAILI